jgi:PAS domain S-box-containing protein
VIPLQLLVIEDSATDAKLMARRLSRAGLAFEWTRVNSEAGLIKALESPVDAILADYSLPGLDVRTALKVAKRRLPETPFIIVSGTMEEEVGVELMKLGADDFLLKDRLGRLGQAVEQSLARAVERRRQSELQSRYLTLFEESPAGKLLVSVEGVPVRANRAICQLLGYSEEELRELRMVDLTHPDDRADSRSAYDTLTGGKVESLRIEERFLTKSGEVRWGDVTSTLLCDSEGRPEHVHSVILDITGRKAAERALHESGERFRGILESLPGFVYTCELDDAYTTTYVSPQIKAVLGVTPDEHLSDLRSWEEVIHPDDRSWVVTAFEDGISGRGQFEAEYRVVARDGTVRWLQDHAVVIRDKGGNPLYCQGVVLDISERRLAQQALLENDAKSKFLANMSHEIRSPLNSVLGFAELLGSRDLGTLSDKQMRYVANIQSSGQVLLSLVNDVLDLAKVASGEMPIHLEWTEVDPIIEACLTLLQPQAAAAGIEVGTAGSAGIAVIADGRRLGQILTNLVSNAIKFTQSRGSVTVTRVVRADVLEIAVQDTGVGIPADKLDYIFDEFAQLESSQDGAYEGTGLGLPLSRRLAELMGGSIAVSSLIGEGTTFTLGMPLLPVAAGEGPPA